MGALAASFTSAGTLEKYCAALRLLQAEQMYTGDSRGVRVQLEDLKKRMNDALDAAGHGSLKVNRGAGGNTGARTQAMHKAVQQAILKVFGTGVVYRRTGFFVGC